MLLVVTETWTVNSDGKLILHHLWTHLWRLWLAFLTVSQAANFFSLQRYIQLDSNLGAERETECAFNPEYMPRWPYIRSECAVIDSFGLLKVSRPPRLLPHGECSWNPLVTQQQIATSFGGRSDCAHCDGSWI